MGITVAVTGPTGEIGVSAVTALEREPAVEKIVAMARRPFEPPTRGWVKTSYHQGDILDRDAVDALVAQADVVIHLAFLIMGSRDESAHVNLQGTRNVFEAAVAATAAAAPGLHLVGGGIRLPLRQPGAADRGRAGARIRRALLLRAEGGVRGRARRHHQGFVVGRLRAAAVHRRRAPGPGVGRTRCSGSGYPGPVRAVAKAVPILKPVVPDPGFPLQLVHHDDVATAIALAATAPVQPGAYNIAGNGEVSIADVAKALGGRSGAGARDRRHGGVGGDLPAAGRPCRVEWLHVARTSVVMDTGKAQRHLGWRPTHSSAETLAALAKAV